MGRTVGLYKEVMCVLVEVAPFVGVGVLPLELRATLAKRSVNFH